ncbi:hypothetical protein Tco_1041640 [Tanacetum coccineum]|uniref:Uncharacterized protein n=1 Tax=Tanacetum coccineum TaxID=301880 RepID=A0ABQ5GGQ2_9ASTR
MLVLRNQCTLWCGEEANAPFCGWPVKPNEPLGVMAACGGGSGGVDKVEMVARVMMLLVAAVMMAMMVWHVGDDVGGGGRLLDWPEAAPNFRGGGEVLDMAYVGSRIRRIGN